VASSTGVSSRSPPIRRRRLSSRASPSSTTTLISSTPVCLSDLDYQIYFAHPTCQLLALRDELLTYMATLASVYQRPPHTFVTKLKGRGSRLPPKVPRILRSSCWSNFDLTLVLILAPPDCFEAGCECSCDRPPWRFGLILLLHCSSCAPSFQSRSS